jgi:hypothetical protein
LATKITQNTISISGVFIGESGAIMPTTTAHDSDIFVLALATLGVAT